MNSRRIGPKGQFVMVPRKCDTDPDLQKDNTLRGSIIIIHQNSQIHQIANPIDTISMQGSSIQRPIIDFYKSPPLTRWEVLAELITIGVFIYTWIHFLEKYNQLPDRVDVNFDIDSSYDTINKAYFALLLLGDTVFYLLMSVLQFLTHKFKYVVEIKATNAMIVFRLTRYFISSYKFTTICLLLYTTIAVFEIINDKWAPQTLYLSSLFASAYMFFGWLYYKKLNQIAIDPFI